MSISKQREKRFWQRWRSSGAVGNMETAWLKHITIRRAGDRIWHLIFQDRVAGEFHLDFLGQMDLVLIRTKSPVLIRKIKELAVSHASQFVKNRSRDFLGKTMINDIRNPGLSEEDSARLMSLETVAMEIRQLTNQQLDQAIHYKEFNGWIQVIDVAFSDLKDFVTKLVITLEKQNEVLLQLIDASKTVIDNVQLSFRVADPNRHFRFWHSVGRPESGFDLYIIPDYHPEQMPDKKEVGMINGSTDCWIQGSRKRIGISTVRCPKEAMTGDPNCIWASFGKVNHPFYAQGREMTMEFSPHRYLSQKAFDEALKFLRGALELDDTYVVVSGGFRPPLECPENVLNRKGLQMPNREGRHDNRCRGSEGFCVWAHRVLKREGTLARAYIPGWFIREGWLKIYAGERVNQKGKKSQPDMS